MDNVALNSECIQAVRRFIWNPTQQAKHRFHCMVRFSLTKLRGSSELPRELIWYVGGNYHWPLICHIVVPRPDSDVGFPKRYSLCLFSSHLSCCRLAAATNSHMTVIKNISSDILSCSCLCAALKIMFHAPSLWWSVKETKDRDKFLVPKMSRAELNLMCCLASDETTQL